MQEDRELVERAKKNDAQAFGELYEIYFDRIYRYIALKTGDRDEAEDMTQQVFMKALKSLGSFKWQNVPFSAWLYRIAHNQVVDHLRKKSRRPTSQLDEAVAPLPDPGVDPEKAAELNCDIALLSQAMRRLTPAQQDVIALRFTSELPIAEVAVLLGKTEGAVKAMQHSAIQALRRIMIND